MDNIEIKERLKKILELKNETANSLSKKTGFSQRTLNRQINEDTAVGYDVLGLISNTYPDINAEWLMTGRGDMINSLKESKAIALYDVDAAAGYESFDVMISKEKIIGEFVVPTFASADWMIYVRGASMYPKYSSGDIIACKVIKESRFIQWNKIYVVATREQGLLVKRLMPSDKEECIKAVSDNERYPPFDIPKDEIFGIALVLGAIKLE